MRASVKPTWAEKSPEAGRLRFRRSPAYWRPPGLFAWRATLASLAERSRRYMPGVVSTTAHSSLDVAPADLPPATAVPEDELEEELAGGA
jgi:hypothetical protein